jgi:hypothetical protein
VDIISLRTEIENTNEAEKKLAQLEKLKHLEQDFTFNFGEQLRTILEDVYDDLCPDAEVQAPLDYLAKHYKVVSHNSKGNMYAVSHKEGIPVEVDEYGQADTKMVILPNPLRIILNIDEHSKEEVWSVNI